MINNLNFPIGIFDSGIGGMAVAKSLMELLPKSSFIYLADTKHMPYGKRTLAEIKQFSTKIIEFLTKQNCQIIVIACNTATAAIEDLVNTLGQEGIKIFNVIDPVVNYVIENYSYRRVGLLCTDLTYRLSIFERKIDNLGNNIYLASFRASQLASLIEKGLRNDFEINQLIKDYFYNHQFKNVDAMILGCTHYLWLKEEFFKLNPFLDWVDPSTLIVNEIKEYLRENTNFNYCLPPKVIFGQTGQSQNFYKLAKQITPKQYQIDFFDCSWGEEYNNLILNNKLTAKLAG